MGNLGFSYVGFIYLLMLIIPNIIWLKYLPLNYTSDHENKILVTFEKIGQILVSVVLLIFIDFNLKGFSFWSLWLFVSFIFMILYEIWWIRYFKGNRKIEDFYSSFFGIPVAGATLPIVSFLLLGIYGKSILLISATIILGIGHIGIHLEHLNTIKK